MEIKMFDGSGIETNFSPSIEGKLYLTPPTSTNCDQRNCRKVRKKRNSIYSNYNEKDCDDASGPLSSTPTHVMEAIEYESPKPTEQNSSLLLANESFLVALENMETDAVSPMNPNTTKRSLLSPPKAGSPDVFGNTMDEALGTCSTLPVNSVKTNAAEESTKINHKKLEEPASNPDSMRTKSHSSSEKSHPAVKPIANQKKKRKKKSKFKYAFTNLKSVKMRAESNQNSLVSSKDALPYLKEEEKLRLSSWNLPASVLRKYYQRGVDSLFPWQLQCLENEKVLDGKNLLYSAPTSAGKTLVSEILMIKRILELGKKAIVVLPFVSVAREKMLSLQDLLAECGIRVEGFMGACNPPGGFQAVDVAICTIEKANSLINRLLEEGTLSQLGTLVVDEIHLLGDSSRGYLLELLLTKIKFMMDKDPSNSFALTNTLSCSSKSAISIQHVVMFYWYVPLFKNTSDLLNLPSVAANTSKPSPTIYETKTKIIGMSATIPNIGDLAKWLGAELIVTDFRPIPLVERIKIKANLCDKNLQPVKQIKTHKEIAFDAKGPEWDLIALCLETILDGYSVLVFAPTKNIVEKSAICIADAFKRIGDPSCNLNIDTAKNLRNQLNGERLFEVITQLKNSVAGLDGALHRSLSFGVAFHHAGLTYEERDILECAFKKSVIRVIVATSTLSAGVNLPARRVIITTPCFIGGPLNPLVYRQMSGRAGRKNIDTEGESILMCEDATLKFAVDLMQSSLQPIRSTLQLQQDSFLTSSMKRAILEVVASGIAVTRAELKLYANCTFLHNSTADHEEDSVIQNCLEFLEKNDFIRLKKFQNTVREPEYMPTLLGSACLASSLSPDEGLVVYKELEKARRCFVLENELHIIYQVTPIYLFDQWKHIDWTLFLDLYENLNEGELLVSKLVGVTELFIARSMMSFTSARNANNAEKIQIHQRFFTALALNDLVKEMPVNEVATKYRVSKGVVQNLQQSASTFAGMVAAFCKKLKWSNLELLLSQFQERLQFGIQRELIDLMRLQNINSRHARSLYDAGVQSVVEVASTEPAEILHILHKSKQFKRDVQDSAELDLNVVNANNQPMTEAQLAASIVDEARSLLQMEREINKQKLRETSANLEKEQASDSSDSLSEKEACSEVIETLDNSLAKLSLSNKTKFEGPQPNNSFVVQEFSILFNGIESSVPDRNECSDTFDGFLRQIESQTLVPKPPKTDAGTVLNDRKRGQSEAIDVQMPSENNTDTNEEHQEQSISSIEDIFSVIHDASVDETPLPKWQQKEFVGPYCVKPMTLRNSSYSERLIVGKNGLELHILEFFSPDQIQFEKFQDDFCGLSFEFFSHKPRKTIGVGYKAIRDDHLPTHVPCHYLSIYDGRSCIYEFQWLHSSGDSSKELSTLNILKHIISHGLRCSLFNIKKVSFKLFKDHEVRSYDDLSWLEKCHDPNIAHWLLTPPGSAFFSSSYQMYRHYFPSDPLPFSKKSMRRSSLESYINFKLMSLLKDKLIEEQLYDHYFRVEIPAVIPLLLMELNGFGVNADALQPTMGFLHRQQAYLELMAFQFAKKQFNLSSPRDVENVLFREIGLTKPAGSRGTGKNVLCRVDNELAKIILQWRKVSNALHNAIFPFSQINTVGTKRIHGIYSTSTCTGRVIISSPSLQCVPNEFELEYLCPSDPFLSLAEVHKIRFGSNIASLLQRLNEKEDFNSPALVNTENDDEKNRITVSLRKLFVSHSSKHVILAADYAQLELRILAHLCRDEKLIEILNTEHQDVFTALASQWKDIPYSEVTQDNRQNVKGVVYGIIYGMGTKTLSKKLEIDEADAETLKMQFLRAFPNINQFCSDKIQSCAKLGYIETICNRKRSLPDIFSRDPAKKAKAQRQAINSSIQGSAADLVKIASVKVYQKLKSVYENSGLPILSYHGPECKAGPSTNEYHHNHPVIFILNLHDELIFEVAEQELSRVSTLIREEMENCIELRVSTPVVMKSGYSWGDLAILKRQLS